MSESTRISRNILVLGGGMEGNGWPSEGTVLRAQAAAQYYHGVSEGGVQQIVCCGSHSGSMEGAPEGDTTEAEWLAGLLRSVGVPQDLLVIEGLSKNSFGTVKELMAKGLVDRSALTAEHPLGVVTVPAHYSRVAPIVRKGLGLMREEIQNIPVEEELGLGFRVSQMAGALVTSVLLAGTPERSIEGIDTAHRRFARLFRRPMR